MERQYKIFLVAAAAIFGGLVIFGLYFFPMIKASEGDKDDNVIKAKIGQKVNVRYSETVVKAIQNLPAKNALEIETSSELHNTDLAGLRGEIRYDKATISYTQNGKEETVPSDAFKTVEYKFLPDAGNTTKYTYDNVEFRDTGDNSQVIVSIKPLSTAEVGKRYTVDLKLDTGNIVKYSFGKRIIEIVP